MLNSKFLFIGSIVLVCVFYFLGYYELNLKSLATDSGFDTSYDSGGSSGGSSDSSGGSSWDTGSSYDYGSSSSGSSSSGSHSSSVSMIILLFVVAINIGLIVYYLSNITKKDIMKFILGVVLFLLMCSVLVFILPIFTRIHPLIAIIMGPILFTVGLAFIIKSTRKIVYSSKTSTTNRVGSFTNSALVAMYERERYNQVPKTEKNDKLLDNCYSIYREVQKAWMDFDYNSMRKLVTDELFNTYQNQLQTLELKGQKNIMNNFYPQEMELLRIDEEKGIYTILMYLKIEFYDYIVDNQNKVLRGSSNQKVVMEYLLTYVDNTNEETKCPNCGAKLEEEVSVCPYCQSNIQGITSLRLAKKEAMRQRPGRNYNR